MSDATAAIILAGSHVWSDEALDALCPRVLLPVANAPLISYALEWLRASGIDAIAICANTASRLLQRYLHSGAQHDLDLYYYEDRIPRGPAGCARDAATALPADHFLVIDGSILPDVHWVALSRAHTATRAAATIVGSANAGSSGPGDGQLSPAGIYVLARRALEYVPATGFQDIKETLIPRLHRAGEAVIAFGLDQPLPRLLELRSYLAAQAWVLERLHDGRLAFEGYEGRDGACAHHSARVAAGARILGPVMIGPDSRIEDGAVIIGPSVLGRQCVVCRRAVVERSVLWDKCVVRERARLDRCVVTSGVWIEAGAVERDVTCSVGAMRRPARHGTQTWRNAQLCDPVDIWSQA